MAKFIKYKFELANEIGVSRSTLSRWINHRYLAKLEALGYEKNQKYLTAVQYNYLKELLCF